MFNKDLNNLVDLMFDPISFDKKSYKFNRDEKDMVGYTIKSDNEKTTIVHNVLGINKKDMKLSCEREGANTFIIINGQTKDEITGKLYSISSRFAVDPSQFDLKKITSAMNNGLLYITIPAKKEVKENKKIEIEIL